MRSPAAARATPKLQPSKVPVVSGDVRARLSLTNLGAIKRDGCEKYQRERNYCPLNWREPFLGRLGKIVWDIYGLLGISKGDFEGTERKHRLNCDFFGAPVFMIFTPDEDLEIGSWLDLGISIGSLSIAARGRARYLRAGSARRLTYLDQAAARTPRTRDFRLRLGPRVCRPSCTRK